MLKTFTLRDLDETLHRKWKIAAAMQGISMEKYVVKSLEVQVTNDLKKTTELKTKIKGGSS